MRDLLIRLDEKVQNGFASITTQLSQISQQQADHDRRIHALEIEVSDRPHYKAEFRKVQDDQSDLSKTVERMMTTVNVGKWVVGLLGVGGVGAIVKTILGL
ncbi:hypothetical protein P6144_00345 [Sphingomonas sp. HITSZ_GF]|uniref:hypothetical protein n=1 Tax=Sphingomonas sp. HITSZ_GF TaxID=3037247 RepID=UPI00240DAD55|nr:hypothetical protein [Sphingomonas sp. HITSZ_GF]MDG2532085.1 hypothetical protein [Sphingomonas sp. HITSZ_GF]